jgi:hypothetical protein
MCVCVCACFNRNNIKENTSKKENETDMCHAYKSGFSTVKNAEK